LGMEELIRAGLCVGTALVLPASPPPLYKYKQQRGLGVPVQIEIAGHSNPQVRALIRVVFKEMDRSIHSSTVTLLTSFLGVPGSAFFSDLYMR
jgi:hypothetical protein